MSKFRVLSPVIAGILVLLATGCAQNGQSGTGDDAGLSDVASLSDDAVVLRVTHSGGYVGPQTVTTRMPIVSVYADGRVVTEGEIIAIYPGPALPNVLLRRVSLADVDKLVNRAVEAGVGGGTDYGTPSVTDMPSTVFTVRTAAGVKTTEVYALNQGAGTSGLTAGQRAARTKLEQLLAALTDLPATLGAAAVGKEEPYVATAVAAVVTEWSVDRELAKEQREIAWPGPALPGDPLGNGLKLTCVTATGDAAAKVLDAARGANALTPWTSGGKRWTLTLRPLLPGETGCADLAKAG